MAELQKVPLGQTEQLVLLPPSELNVPSSHGVHTSPFFPVNPGMHVQFLIVLDITGEDEFEGHAIH